MAELSAQGLEAGHDNASSIDLDVGEVRASSSDIADQPVEQAVQRQRQLGEKDNIFGRNSKDSSSSSDDERLCSTNSERKNRDACIKKECSGESRTSLCAKRCRYEHCISSPAEREGRGCNTREDLTCKVDCFGRERCDDKKNDDKAEACRRDCRKGCCGDSEDDDEDEDAKRVNDGGKDADNAGGDDPKSVEKGAEGGGDVTEGGMADSRDAALEPGADPSALDSVGPTPDAASSSTADPEDDGIDQETGAITPLPASANGGTGKEGGGEDDGEYVPVELTFNLPVADEDITARDILTGADENTVLEDVEGGLALLLPVLAENAFGGGGGSRRKRALRMLRNSSRKMLVEYSDAEPPKITNVASARKFLSFSWDIICGFVLQRYTYLLTSPALCHTSSILIIPSLCSLCRYGGPTKLLRF